MDVKRHHKDRWSTSPSFLPLHPQTISGLDRFFGLTVRGTTPRRELVAGITTFLTLSYIVVVNPQILAAAGIDPGAAFVATCLAGAFGTALMGLWANYPIALAPGMGLNAYFAFTVVGTMGIPWQVALGAVLVSGVLMMVISVLPVREWILHSIPRSQKMAIAAGIGAFLGLIALRGLGAVVAHPETLVTLGDLTSWTVVLAAVGFVVIAALDFRRVPGAILIGIVGVSVVGWIAGLSPAPDSLFSAPPSLATTFFEFDLVGALELGLLAIVFAFLMIDLFDTTGTLVATLTEAGLVDDQGRVPRLRRALVADGAASVVGAMLGTSTTTSYIESAAGIRVGGKTGLTAVVVAGLFVLALFVAPLAGTVPVYATAPAILFVACAMARALGRIEWGDVSEAVPAMVTVLAMPFTHSIATGIGMGFLSYVGIKALAGRFSDVSAGMWFVSGLFAIKFAIG